MTATDGKINALFRSRMMKRIDFQRLVGEIDRFFYNQKLYHLMRKRRLRGKMVSDQDSNSSFYNILLEMLYEVSRNETEKQSELFESVLDWYCCNIHRLSKLRIKEATKKEPIVLTSPGVGADLELNSRQYLQRDDFKIDQNSKQFKGNTQKLYPNIKSQPIDLVLDGEYATQSSKVYSSFPLGLIGTQKTTTYVDPEARWKTIQGAENRLTNPFVQRQGVPSPLYSKRQSKLCWVKRPTPSPDCGKLQEEPRIHAALGNVQCLEEFYQMTDRCSSPRGLKGLSANKQQGTSRQQKPQNPFLKKTAPINFGDVLDVLETKGLSSKTDLMKKKRAQSVPLRQSPSLPKRCVKSQRPDTALTLDSARDKIAYFDWRGHVGQEPSGYFPVAKPRTEKKLWNKYQLLKMRTEGLDLGNWNTSQQAMSPKLRQKKDSGQTKISTHVSGMDGPDHAVRFSDHNFVFRAMDESSRPLPVQDSQVQLKHEVQCFIDARDGSKGRKALAKQIPSDSPCRKLHVPIFDCKIDVPFSVVPQQPRDQFDTKGTPGDAVDQMSLEIRGSVDAKDASSKEEQADNLADTDSGFQVKSIFMLKEDAFALIQPDQKTALFEEDRDNVVISGETVSEQQYLPQMKKDEFVSSLPLSSDVVQQPQPTEYQEQEGTSIQIPAEIPESKSPAKGLAESTHLPSIGRPIPIYFQPKDPAITLEHLELRRKANKAVNIHQIFTDVLKAPNVLPSSRPLSQRLQKHQQQKQEFKIKHNNLKRKLFSIYNRTVHPEVKQFHQHQKSLKMQGDIERKRKRFFFNKGLRKYQFKQTAKLKQVQPHWELISAFRLVKKKSNKKKQIKAAICIQKYTRAWLVRMIINRIKTKASKHGNSLPAVVNLYRQMILRIRKRYGAPWSPPPLIYSELEEWLDSKSRYEVAFIKRQFWMEIQKHELQHYFKDCEHFPSMREISNAWTLVYPGTKRRLPNVIKMRQLVEMAFTIYPPQGANLGKYAPRRSTWVRPVINGIEAQRYLLYGHPVLKATNIRSVAHLVNKALRERKMMQVLTQTTSQIEIRDANVALDK